MTEIIPISKAFGNEEDIIRNLNSIINNFLVNNKTIDYITKHFFYAKVLIQEMALHQIPFKVLYLGAGVRRITTNLDVENTPETLIKVQLTSAERREIWQRAFGDKKLRAKDIVEFIQQEPNFCNVFNNMPKRITPTAIGACLAELQKTNPWLKCQPEWVAKIKNRKRFWWAE